MENRHQNLSTEEKQAINSYFNTFHMYCENNVIERFRRLQGKLADKNMIFRIVNGSVSENTVYGLYAFIGRCGRVCGESVKGMIWMFG